MPSDPKDETATDEPDGAEPGPGVEPEAPNAEEQAIADTLESQQARASMIEQMGEYDETVPPPPLQENAEASVKIAREVGRTAEVHTSATGGVAEFPVGVFSNEVSSVTKLDDEDVLEHEIVDDSIAGVTVLRVSGLTDGDVSLTVHLVDLGP